MTKDSQLPIHEVFFQHNTLNKDSWHVRSPKIAPGGGLQYSRDIFLHANADICPEFVLRLTLVLNGYMMLLI